MVQNIDVPPAGTVTTSAELPLDKHMRAMSVEEFCCRYGVGKTLAYELLDAGKLKAKKCGRRTLILPASAEEWFRNLPSWISPVGHYDGKLSVTTDKNQ